MCIFFFLINFLFSQHLITNVENLVSGKSSERNEVVAECAVETDVRKEYEHFFQRIAKYMDQKEQSNVFPFLMWFVEFIYQNCNVTGIDNFPEHQETALQCSKKLIQEGDIIPVYNSYKHKRLKPILVEFGLNNCARGHEAYDELNALIDKECPNSFEQRILNNFELTFPDHKCAPASFVYVNQTQQKFNE